MKILFVIDSLETGGAERILIYLLNILSNEEKYDLNITLLTIQNKGPLLKQLPNSIKHISIIKFKNNHSINKLLNKLLLKSFYYLPLKMIYKIFVREKYDTEVAYLEGLSTKFVGSSLNKKSKKIAFVHTDLILNPWSTKNFINLKSEINYYKIFDEVFTVSSEVKSSFERKYLREAKVLLNPLDDKRILDLAHKYHIDFTSEVFSIVSVGRLVREKGFDRLIRIVSKLCQEGIRVRLVLIGDGYERKNLETLAKEKLIYENVLFMGNQINPYPYMINSDLFVSSSHVEGYSTVVCEAVILGLPIVATDCSGMKDILGNSEYGLIVPNTDEDLYRGIKLMIQDKTIYNAYKVKVLERQSYFDSKNRISEYLKVLHK